MKRYFFLLIGLVLMFSCKKEEKDPGCGCDGPVIETLKDIKASYIGTGTFLLRRTRADGEIYEAVYTSCSRDESWTTTADIKEPDYVINAEIRKRCEPLINESIYSIEPINITSIRKTL